MTLQFDDFGYLLPYEVIPLDLAAFERTFVLDAEREKLFRSLMDLVLDLKNLGAGSFYIWADGSFVTKKRVPRDIDLVVFISHIQMEKISKHRTALEIHFQDDLDIFFENDFPEDHPNHYLTVGNKLRWRETFCYDRLHRKKGIVQLQF